MILRRLSQSLKAQDWLAISIEFVLLVAGVFLGIQVANWNQSRAFDALERGHLHNLRAEIDLDIEATIARARAVEKIRSNPDISSTLTQWTARAPGRIWQNI